MGCCSSKVEPNRESKTVVKKAESKVAEFDEKSKAPSINRIHQQNLIRFTRLVRGAVLKINDFCTISDIESYISSHHRPTVDAFTRRKIICRVISEEFFRGNIRVRRKKLECL